MGGFRGDEAQETPHEISRWLPDVQVAESQGMTDQGRHSRRR